MKPTNFLMALAMTTLFSTTALAGSAPMPPVGGSVAQEASSMTAEEQREADSVFPAEGGVDVNASKAIADAGPIEVQNYQGIPYATGGIGDEERAQLESMEPQYNLKITSAYKDGAYVGTNHVVVKDSKGKVVLDVSSDAGPLFLAQLPAGSYTVEDTADNHPTQTKKITVGKGKNSRIAFYW